MAVIGDYFEFQNGFAFKSSDFSVDGKYKVVKIKELKDGVVKFFEDSASITPDDDFDVEKYIIRKGDVLFALTGDPVSKPNPLSWVGRVSVYDHDIPALLNQRVCKAIPTGNISLGFLYYFFRQYKEFYALAAKASGSASQANISTKTIQQHEFEKIPVDEMNRIVSILDTLDRKIKLNISIAENMKQQIFSIYENMFAEMDGNGSVGDILVENPKSKIKVGDAREKKGEFPFYTSGLSVFEYPEYLVDGKNIYLNTGGNAGVKYHMGKAAYSTDTWSVNGGETLTDYLYVYFSLMEKEMNSIYFEGSALKHLQKKKLLNREIYIPTANEITLFNENVRPMFALIANKESENKLIISIRDTLLPELLAI